MTVNQMIKKPKPRYAKAVYRFAGVLLIAILAIPVLHMWKSAPPKEADKPTAAVHKQFRIKDYLVPEQLESSKSKIYGLVSDLDLEEMDQKMLKTVQDDFPSVEHLKVPEGFESKLFYRKFKRDENTKRAYPMIDYYAVKEDYTLTLSIQDRHIPRCVLWEGGESYLKGYKDYQIAVIKGADAEGNKLFWAYGTYQNYDIEIFAMVEHADDFEQFMQSFLK